MKTTGANAMMQTKLSMQAKLSFSSGRDYCAQLASFIGETQITTQEGNVLEFNPAVSWVVAKLQATRQNQKKIMIIGNGGSAAIATHLQNDLCKVLKIRAQAFYDTALYSAIANDEGVEAVFEHPIQLFAESGDSLFAISSSGRSQNILRAAQQARQKNCSIVTLSGFKPDNPLRKMGDINFYVPTQHYGMVELAHQVLVHCFTDLAMIL